MKRLKNLIREVRHADPLAIRMLIAIISFSSVITLAATAIQLYTDYTEMVGTIRHSLDDIGATRVRTLSSSVWTLDDTLIAAQLDGILRMNNVVSAAVEVDGATIWWAGRSEGRNQILESFPLTYPHRGKMMRIGTLKVTADLDPVYTQLVDRGAMILASNAIKTFLVAILIFVLFRRWITRHLFSIADYSRHFDPSRKGPAFALARPPKPGRRPDILDHLVAAFNETGARLADTYEQIAYSERKLAVINRHLEDRVVEHEASVEALRDAQDTLEQRVDERTRQLSREITERRAVEAALVASEERLRDIVEATSDWFWEIDRDEAFTFLAGKPREDVDLTSKAMMGRTVQELMGVHRIPGNNDWMTYEECFRERRPFRDLDLPFRTVTGEPMFLRVSGKPTFDSQGQFTGYRGSTTDVTVLKQTERRLGTFRRMLDTAGQGLAIGTIDGTIIYNNQAICDLTESGNAEHMPGRKCRQFYTGEDYTKLTEEVLPTVLDKGQWHGEINLTSTSGRKVPVIADFFPIRDDLGDQTLIGGVFTDISEQKAAAETLRAAKLAADKANRAKSEFLSSMSHELRTPLNAILGFGQILELNRDDNLTGQQQEYLGLILKSGRHLLGLINEVLDLSKIEAGKVDLSLEPVMIDELLSECIPLIEAMAVERGISVSVEHVCGCEGPTKVTADHVRLKQAVLNLLSNAVKYNRENGKILVKCGMENESMFRLNVIDTGYGIPPEMEEQIFTPFARLGAETTETEGTGIGLALTRRLVELMGGRIGYTSSIDQGTTFWIDLPLAVADREEASHEQRIVRAPLPSRNPGGPAQPYKVLYVEDNPANLRLMEAILKDVADINLMSTHTAELGLGMARVEKPDFLIVDINLPGMNGLELIRRLKGNAETRDIPTIALSASALKGDRQRALSAGFDACLSKPVDIDELISILREHLRTGGQRTAAE